MPSPNPLRIGILGAARIVPMALLRPARHVPSVQIAAVAARDPLRASAFARKHGIPTTHPSYDALLADPEVDVIYNPLPNSHHAEWSIRALEAGKHVLCEKPLASNATEAQQMVETARRCDRLLVEAFHPRYHPLASRMQEILASGAIGEVRHIETHMCIPLLRPGDIRYRYDLAGGATMDVGCYTINLLRLLAGAEPVVRQARALCSSPQVDRFMEADLAFADGRTGRITCSLFSTYMVWLGATVRGSRGEMRILNPYLPHLYHRLTIRSDDGRRTEHVAGEATYTLQLRSLVEACREGAPVLTDGSDGVANMRVIDAVYDAAGLKPRGT